MSPLDMVITVLVTEMPQSNAAVGHCITSVVAASLFGTQAPAASA